MIVSCDAKQLEWRGILELSQDQVGIGEVLAGEDTHALNQKYLNLEPGKPGRLIAKIFLFRTIFRGSGWSFANDPDFMHVSTSASFWDKMNAKFFAKYKAIDAAHKKWADIVMSGQPIIGPLGREWFIKNRDANGELFVPWTTLTNYPVQGTCADIMTIARVSFFNRFRKAGFKGKLIQTVHDSIVADVPDEEVQDIVNLFHAVFADLTKNIYNIFGYEWKTPLHCETSVGPNLYQLKEMKQT